MVDSIYMGVSHWMLYYFYWRNHRFSQLEIW